MPGTLEPEQPRAALLTQQKENGPGRGPRIRWRAWSQQHISSLEGVALRPGPSQWCPCPEEERELGALLVQRQWPACAGPGPHPEGKGPLPTQQTEGTAHLLPPGGKLKKRVEGQGVALTFMTRRSSCHFEKRGRK